MADPIPAEGLPEVALPSSGTAVFPHTCGWCRRGVAGRCSCGSTSSRPTEAVIAMSDLNPDGPHSPGRTAEAGQMFDDVSRLLCYATMPRKGGLKYPADVYRLVADIYTATGRIPQMCSQLEDFLRAQAATGRLYEARGRDIAVVTDHAAVHLSQARAAAHNLTRALQAVQADISGLGVREN